MLSALFQALIVDLCEGKILRAVGPPTQGMGLGVGSLGLGSPRKGTFPPQCHIPGNFHVLGQRYLSVTHPGGMSHERMSPATASILW